MQRLFLWTPGGTTIYANVEKTAGVSLAAGGGSWSSVSSRERKENFVALNGVDVLARLARLPLSTWNHNAQDAAVRHLGPMAQDFAAAFGVGENETTISTVDADGVALATIQGLHQIVQEKDAEIAALKADAAAQKREMAELRRLVDVLLARTAPDGRVAQLGGVPR